ncbi:MAG: hypothetical protein IKJ75_06130 [Clostridia bacterium]|nr:hypothetical protein [Clostridia bacterium]MBR3839284.1 hypothetical protein [Clostridia bacterium]
MLRCCFSKYVIKDKRGMSTIEVIIIIAVLVTLALIFRTFIMDIASDIFDKIKEKTDSSINDL